MVSTPQIAASATLALNPGEWVRPFRLITPLQTVSLILEEALIAVHSLSNQWEPALANLFTSHYYLYCRA